MTSTSPEGKEHGILSGDANAKVGNAPSSARAQQHRRHMSSEMCSRNNEVKSRAVVKYSAAPPLSNYALLQKTDLNLPLANWPRGNPQLGGDAGGARANLFGSSSGKSKPFSSFGMAYDFIDYLEGVDVVSDSENVKKLLKIPYSKSQVSMAVHCVGRTLFLDELNVQELFMRSSQRGDWMWLKEFCQRLTERKWKRKKKSKELCYQKAILSKFLYYSMNGDGVEEPSTKDPNQRDEESGAEEFSPSWLGTFTSSDLEESKTPKQESVCSVDSAAFTLANLFPKDQTPPRFFSEGERGQGLRNDFTRNIEWTFEDIHMLVGSNMNIFGGRRHPAVSLRLRDNNKPINILTGIDYWLDNLMCNVPELLMCFHVDGVVQRYEMIKTEDIPDLKDSTFSTREVTDIARNILSFLKSNCTKEGHTYWLFKDSGSDTVKLYDLTALCEEAEEEEKCQNPFSLPVAVLLYKVASNLMLKEARRRNRKHYGTIRTLLLNCVKLLEQEERHPQMVASAHYMLSELFQLDEPPEEEESGDESLPAASGSEDSSHSDTEWGEEEELLPGKKGSYSTCSSDPLDDSKAVAVIRSVGELSIPERYTSSLRIRQSHAFPVSQDKEERCRQVLGCVLKGLKVVDDGEKESDLPAAEPNTPIPLQYKDGSAGGACDTEKGLSLLGRAGSFKADQKHRTFSGMIPGSWQHRMKLQLFLKASKAYYVLSDAAADLRKYGRALRYIKLALQCYDAFCSVSSDAARPQAPLLFHYRCLSLCGDIQLMLAQNPGDRAAHLEEYSYQTREDQEILHSLHQESSCLAFAVATDLTASTEPEHQLFVSSKCYEAAHEVALNSGVVKSDHGADELPRQALRRLGNVRNEMGVYYMNRVAAAMPAAERHAKTAEEQELWKKSFSCFEAGLKDFETIQDSANVALLLCNTGRLMRVCARAHRARVSTTEGTGREFSPEEALYYNKAISYYVRATQSLASRGRHPAVWDSVNWELCTTYYTLATLLQEHAPLSRPEQVERQVTEAMMKSLRYCDLQTESPRQLLYRRRAAAIHQRLASMHHSCFRNQVGGAGERSRKQQRSLAELHYGKAVALLLGLKDATLPCELLRALLERAALAQSTAAGQSGGAAKLKTLTGALEIVTQTSHAFHLIHKELLRMSDAARPTQEEEEEAGQEEGGATVSAGVDLQEVEKLTATFESSLSSLLLQLVKLTTAAAKCKPSGKDQELLKTYKDIYAMLLRAEKNAALLERVELYLELLRQLAVSGGK